jgi:single-stranded DNA-binding protein
MSTTTSQPKSNTKKSDQPPANLFMGIGRLGQDPTLRYTGDGRAWVKTSLAIFQGEDKDPIWLDLKAFAKPLEKGGFDERVPLAIAELKKGQKIAVRGKLYCDKHEHNGKQYVDWGLVLFNAPTVMTDVPSGADAGKPEATSEAEEEVIEGEPD